MGSHHPDGPAVRSPGHGFAPRQNPPPVSGSGPHPELDPEAVDPVFDARGRDPDGRFPVVRVNPVGPGGDLVGELAGTKPQHGGARGAEVNLPGLDVPVPDSVPAGFHGQLEPFLAFPERRLGISQVPLRLDFPENPVEDLGEQLGEVRSLDQVVSRPELHHLDGDRLVPVSGHGHERDGPAPVLQGPNQFGPRHVGQFLVEEQNQVGVGRHPVRRLGSGHNSFGVKAGPGQDFLSQAVEDLVVLHHQYFSGGEVVSIGCRVGCFHSAPSSPLMVGTWTTARNSPN